MEQINNLTVTINLTVKILERGLKSSTSAADGPAKELLNVELRPLYMLSGRADSKPHPPIHTKQKALLALVFIKAFV